MNVERPGKTLFPRHLQEHKSQGKTGKEMDAEKIARIISQCLYLCRWRCFRVGKLRILISLMFWCRYCYGLINAFRFELFAAWL